MAAGDGRRAAARPCEYAACPDPRFDNSAALPHLRSANRSNTQLDSRGTRSGATSTLMHLVRGPHRRFHLTLPSVRAGRDGPVVSIGAMMPPCRRPRPNRRSSREPSRWTRTSRPSIQMVATGDDWSSDICDPTLTIPGRSGRLRDSSAEKRLAQTISGNSGGRMVSSDLVIVPLASHGRRRAVSHAVRRTRRRCSSCPTTTRLPSRDSRTEKFRPWRLRA